MSVSARLIFKTIVFTALFPGTVTAVVPLILLYREGGLPMPHVGLWQVTGAAPLFLGVFFFLACVRDFALRGEGTPAPVAPPRKLVIQGPYRFVRNPMFVGMSLILVGEAMITESRSLAIYCVIMPFVFHLYVTLHEERELRERFGDAYEQYCRKVPRWLPRLRLPPDE